MRNPLRNNQRIKLVSADEETAARELVVRNLIGMGANVIAYEATDKTGKICYILKECYPEISAERQPDGIISWKNPALENAAKKRMQKAYDTQLKLQNEAATENTNTQLADTLYKANNTLYTITEHKNAITYNKVEDRNLQETLITARSIARAVKAYHDGGYLHLDIKPQNVMILPETRDMVILLDFDSVTRMDELADASLSYSPNYAAPEQVQGRVSRISPATDVYAIGAIVFNRIFTRLPDLEDQSVFSDWDYSDNHIFARLSMKVRRLMTEFLRKTLSASVKNRFQTMDGVIAALDILVKESDPEKRFIIDEPPACFNTFVGRDTELKQIHEKLQGNNPVFITGMKGIGKTELAKNYARKYRSDYDVIRFAEYDSSLADLISSGELVAIENNNDEAITINSFAGLVDDRTLLIIDNYRISDGSPSDGKLFDKLASLKCKSLVTTYENAQDLYKTSEWIELGELNAAEQFRLFEKEYGASLSDRDSKLAGQILKEIKGFTLLIPLIAKLLKNSRHSFDDVYQNISEAGTADITGKVLHNKDSRIIKGTIGAIVGTVLDMSNLSDDEHYVMNCLTVLRGIRINRSKLIEWIGSQHDDAITELVRNHWINADGKGKDALLSMHDVIREIVRKDKALQHDTSWIQKPVDEYLSDTKRFGQNHTYLPGSYPEILNSIGVINPLTGLDAVQIGKKRKLIDTLLRTIDIENEPSKLIDIAFSIIDHNLERAYNYMPDYCIELNFIELLDVYKTLPLTEKFKLHNSLMYLNLRDLCKNDHSREEDEVLLLCHAAKMHAEWIVSVFENYENRETTFYIFHEVFRAFLTAGVTLGSSLFKTEHSSSSSKALEEYSDFFNQIAQRIKREFPERVAGDPENHYYPFEERIEHFHRCMDPDNYDQIWKEFIDEENGIGLAEQQNYEKYMHYMAEYGEDEDERKRYKVELLADDLRSEAAALVEQCEKMGYTAYNDPFVHPEINIEHLTNPATLEETTKLLSLAKDKLDSADKLERETYEIPDSVSYHYNYHYTNWFAVSCIHACCTGDFAAAKNHYSDYLAALSWELEIFSGGVNLKIYNTLSFLGFSDICPEILRLNIQQIEKNLTDNKKNRKVSDERFEYLFPTETEDDTTETGWRGDRIDATWVNVSKILEYAEMLSDEALIRKYSAIKKDLEDPGFEFET